MYEIRYYPEVARRDLKKLDPPVANKILKQIEKKLVAAPQEYGHPLRYALKGYWRLRVEEYRIVYEIDSRKSVVTIWLIDKRRNDEVYIEFLKRMVP